MGQVPDTPGLLGERKSGGGIDGGRQPWKAAREEPLVDPEGRARPLSVGTPENSKTLKLLRS